MTVAEKEVETMNSFKKLFVASKLLIVLKLSFWSFFVFDILVLFLLTLSRKDKDNKKTEGTCLRDR